MKTKKSDDHILIHLTAKDLSSPEATKEQLEDVLIHNRDKRLVISLKNISSIDSMGIGVLVSIHVLGMVEECPVVFTETEEKIQKFFERTNMDTILNLTPTVEDALVYEFPVHPEE